MISSSYKTALSFVPKGDILIVELLIHRELICSMFFLKRRLVLQPDQELHVPKKYFCILQ